MKGKKSEKQFSSKDQDLQPAQIVPHYITTNFIESFDHSRSTIISEDRLESTKVDVVNNDHQHRE